jgi:transcriptional regulator with XRE-family HTH domain
MDALGMESPEEVRTQFGLRLRELRLEAGFKTARSFARALNLEENRYTRYERGEVEPNLLNIGKMCRLLGVDANRLLGLADNSNEQTGPIAMAERVGSGAMGTGRSAEAWRLASVIASLPSSEQDQSQSAGQHDPLVQLRSTAEIYRRLLSDDPGHVVAELLSEGALSHLASGRKTELLGLIDGFMGARDMPDQDV